MQVKVIYYFRSGGKLNYETNTAQSLDLNRLEVMPSTSTMSPVELQTSIDKTIDEVITQFCSREEESDEECLSDDI